MTHIRRRFKKKVFQRHIYDYNDHSVLGTVNIIHDITTIYIYIASIFQNIKTL